MTVKLSLGQPGRLLLYECQLLVPDRFDMVKLYFRPDVSARSPFSKEQQKTARQCQLFGPIPTTNGCERMEIMVEVKTFKDELR